ncbi:hypothetical protein DFR75_106114 [Nocardia ignorata]|uniref:Uncharacterized protein n=2 Tax=Nocardia ignorata TaxID=145285 RepID=A0A4R6P3H4_NOCIG|nr:hypothetical protein DFR75_106114 [Nocardia ignorata]
MEEAAQIRQRWEAAGKPECDSHTLVREYYLGTATGDKVCTKCGGTFLNGQQVE